MPTGPPADRTFYSPTRQNENAATRGVFHLRAWRRFLVLGDVALGDMDSEEVAWKDVLCRGVAWGDVACGGVAWGVIAWEDVPWGGVAWGDVA